MNEVVNYVTIENGKSVTTSKLVALKFGKQHKNVLRDIRNLDCSLEFRKLNFELLVKMRELPQGGASKDDEYIMTKDGFFFLISTFTGTEAAKFKEEYINEFNRRGREIYSLAKELAAKEAITPFQEKIGTLNTELAHAQFKLGAVNDLVNEKNRFINLHERMLNYAYSVLKSDGVYTTTELAAQLDMTAQALNKKLSALKIIYKKGDHWFLYAKYLGKKHQVSRTNVHTRNDGGYNSNTYMVWTEKGRSLVHNAINPLQPVKLVTTKSNLSIAS